VKRCTQGFRGLSISLATLDHFGYALLRGAQQRSDRRLRLLERLHLSAQPSRVREPSHRVKVRHTRVGTLIFRGIHRLVGVGRNLRHASAEAELGQDRHVELPV